MLFLQEYGLFLWCMLLSMLVTERKRTPGYCDAYSVGTPQWAFWVKRGLKNRKTTLLPCSDVFFLVSNRTIFFSWEVVIWMPNVGRARHLGPGKRYFTLVNCRLSVSTLVGG